MIGNLHGLNALSAFVSTLICAACIIGLRHGFAPSRIARDLIMCATGCAAVWNPLVLYLGLHSAQIPCLLLNTSLLFFLCGAIRNQAAQFWGAR